MARNFHSSLFFWIRIGGTISGRNNSSILSCDLAISLSLDSLSLSLSLSLSQCSPKAWQQLRVFFHPLKFHSFSSNFISSCPNDQFTTPFTHNQNVHNQGPKMLYLGSKNYVPGQKILCVWATTICVWAAKKIIRASGQA